LRRETFPRRPPSTWPPCSRRLQAPEGGRNHLASPNTTLILCIHNHQPVGNLPEVFEFAYEKSYLPFLDVIEKFPSVKFVLHNTGPLLEWYEAHAPDYLARVRGLVERGQAEILTGGFYEPIISAIPEIDALGQIEKMSRYVESTFGQRPRGMWLAERVWEPHLASLVSRAGVQYVPLDDYEFRLAGLSDSDLTGYYITEDQGYPLEIFPISKRLRYAVPFQEPEETIDILRELSERGEGLMALFGDDGEKFGVWPGTHEHVYTGGWLERFLGTLLDNSDWLETTTFAEYRDREPARGRVYLPASSYPEMMEWALPTPARRSYEALLERLKDDGTYDEWAPFLSGGTWKNFLSKYDEANVMTRKMFRVSAKVAAQARRVDLLPDTEVLTTGGRDDDLGLEPAVDAAAVALARDELWRGQCNCAYWHGVFGGLYLPHLRSAIYQQLIRAENLADSERGKRWDSLDVTDHDLDGDPEVLLESDWGNVYVAPKRGGTVFELDIRRAESNLAATMSRHDEAYHYALRESGDVSHEGDGVPSIHDGVTAKEKGLERLLVPDRYPRRCAIDHVYPRGTRPDEIARGEAVDLGGFLEGRYDFEPWREDGAIGVTMRTSGCITADGTSLGIEKNIWLLTDETVRIDYALVADGPVDVLFAPEWNIAFLTANEDYVSFAHGARGPLPVGRRWTIENTDGVTFTDRLREEKITLSMMPAGGLWLFPLETASQSEGGVERVFQGVTAVTHWPLRLAAGKRASFSITLSSRQIEE
jgi:hypothetical protein